MTSQSLVGSDLGWRRAFAERRSTQRSLDRNHFCEKRRRPKHIRLTFVNRINNLALNVVEYPVEARFSRLASNCFHLRISQRATVRNLAYGLHGRSARAQDVGAINRVAVEFRLQAAALPFTATLSAAAKTSFLGNGSVSVTVGSLIYVGYVLAL